MMTGEMGRVDGILQATPLTVGSGQVGGSGTSGMTYQQTVNLSVYGQVSPVETARQIELQSRLLALEF